MGGDGGLKELLPVESVAVDLADDLAVDQPLAPVIAAEPIDGVEGDAADAVDPLEAVSAESPMLDQPDEALAALLEDYEGEEFEVDPEDLGEVLDEIDDAAVDQLVNGGNTLTLAQVQQLFELYFNTINNTTITENTTNNTYVDNSIN